MSNPPQTNRQLRVLITDDEPAIRHLLSEALSNEGYEVREALHGREVLDTLKVWQPNVIVLDLMMPIMDGWTFLMEKRRIESANIPVIVISAHRLVEGEAESLGVTAVFPKPFDLDELLDCIARTTASSTP